MGTQGEIYNVLGIILPAREVEKDKLYSINGKSIATHEKRVTSADFESGLSYDSNNPKFSIRILGFTEMTKGHHFDGEALVGYSVANESYLGHATALMSQEEIDALRPKLSDEIREKIGFDISPEKFKIYLVYDWDQGDVDMGD